MGKRAAEGGPVAVCCPTDGARCSKVLSVSQHQRVEFSVLSITGVTVCTSSITGTRGKVGLLGHLYLMWLANNCI